jgi:hypothetical protein
MKYMLMICNDESVILSPTEAHALPQIQAWDAEVSARGIRRGGARLRPSSDATTVRVRGSEVLVSDGPFGETKEQMGGFDIIECASLDEAVEIAARHPAPPAGQSRSDHSGKNKSGATTQIRHYVWQRKQFGDGFREYRSAVPGYRWHPR